MAHHLSFALGFGVVGARGLMGGRGLLCCRSLGDRWVVPVVPQVYHRVVAHGVFARATVFDEVNRWGRVAHFR